MSLYVSSRVWKSSVQKADRLLLLLALAFRANDEGVAWPSQDSLAKDCRCSRRGVQRMLDALIAEGEIELVKAGGNGAGDHAIYKLPTYSEGGLIDLLTTFGKGDPGANKGDPGAKKGRKLSVQSVPEPNTTVRTKGDTDPVVVNIYEAYPKKVGRPAALKAIANACRSIDADQLLELTAAYAKSVAGADLQFIPHPATWFNQERYNDDPKTWTRSDSRDRTQSSRNAGTANEGKSSQYRGVGQVR